MYADIQLTVLKSGDYQAYGAIAPNRLMSCGGTWSYAWKQSGFDGDGNFGSTDMNRHVFKQNFYNNGLIVMDDDPEKTATLPTITSNCDRSLYVGCSHYGSTWGLYPLRIYGFMISSNDTLVCDFRPAKDADGVPCFYDVVRGTTHYSKGSKTAAAFVAGPDLTNPDELVVTGMPSNVGTVSPAYGVRTGLNVGDSFLCQAPASTTNVEAGVAGTCLGYKVYTNGVVMVSGSENEFTYTHPDNMTGATLAWQWDASYAVRSVAGVTVSAPWVAAGDTVTLTATNPEGQELYRWVDSVTGKVYKGNPLTIAVTEPLNLEPVFGTLYHVDTNGSDDTTTGTSRETAFKTVGKALAKCVGGDSIKVWASATPYEVTDVLTLDKGVSVFGSTDNPADTVIKRKSGDNGIFSLNHADAEVRNLTVADGYRGHSKGGAGGVNIWANGGTLYNCIVRGCSDGNYANGGGIYIEDKSPALVDRCVISNCTTYISSGSDGTGGSAIQMHGGTVRNTLCVENRMDGDAAQGGTIRMMGGVLENCTIANNKGAKCAGIRVTGTTAVIRNCIISDNTSTGLAEPSAIEFSGDSTSCIANCLLDGAVNENCLVETQALESVWAGLFQPKVGSKALDAATSESWMTEPGAKDLAGNVRVNGTKADLGALERDASVAAVSVVPSVTDGFSPLSVTFTVKTQNISGACTYRFDWKGDGTDITEGSSATVTKSFAEGTYFVKVSVTAGGVTYSMPGYIRIFSVSNQIEVNPGESIADALAQAVAGCEIILKKGTHPVSARTVIDKGVTVRGETGNPDDVIVQSQGQSFTVFLVNHVNAILKDVTVADGYQHSNESGAAGVNIGVNGGTLYHCVVRGGLTDFYATGGGIYIYKDSPGLVDRCVVSNCTTWTTAGSDSYGGSAIHLAGGTVRNTLCVGNFMRGASAPGGTVRMTGGVLENCTIAGNWGAVCPGIRVTGSTALIRNCIVSSNATDSATASDRVFSGTSTSCLSKTVMDVDLGAAGVLFEEPAKTFRNPSRGDWRLSNGSDAVNYADYYPWMDTALDLRGNPRIRGKKPDAGCYEASGGGFTLIVR